MFLKLVVWVLGVLCWVGSLRTRRLEASCVLKILLDFHDFAQGSASSLFDFGIEVDVSRRELPLCQIAFLCDCIAREKGAARLPLELNI